MATHSRPSSSSSLTPVIAPATNATLNHLLKSAELLFTRAPAVSRHLVSTFRARALHDDINLAPALRQRLCSSCGSISMPGVTSSASVVWVNKRRKRRRRKPNADADAASTNTNRQNGHKAKVSSEGSGFRVPAQPIKTVPADNGQPARRLATNLRSVCNVCGHVAYAPGESFDQIAAAKSVPPLLPLGVDASSAMDKADTSKPSNKTPTAPSGTDSKHPNTPGNSSTHKQVQPDTPQIPNQKNMQKKPQPQPQTQSQASTAQDSKPKKKKTDKRKMNLQSILKRQNQDKDKDKGGGGYSLTDFLSTL